MPATSNHGDRPNGPESGPAGAQPEPGPNPNNYRGHDQTHHSASPPQPAMGYPPVMGYPPPPGPYPPPPNYNPYPPYPPTPGYYPPSPNPYHQTPPAYMHPPHGSSVHRPSPLEGFIRGVVTFILVVIIVSCLLSIVTFILFRPLLPEYQVTSFSVTNFNISNGVLAGNWDAAMLVHNPNPNQKASFDRTKAYVYHGSMVNYLSSSMVHPMTLGVNATSTIHVRNTMANQDQPPEWIVTAIGEERGGGSVKFEMALAMLAAFKSEMGWTTHLSMMVYCKELTVRFPNATAASGSAASTDLPRRCMIIA